ncbi:MAG: transposase, partial [Desulfuromonadales bacterium]|nr:transposase [Desulfuromonadales bacterium]
MARIARVVVPGYPHHITQRGNRRQQVFFNDEDYLAYIDLMAEWCRKHDVDIWAWCLMPNHVHLIAVPQTEDGL